MTEMRINNLAEVFAEISRCYQSLHLLLEMEREQFFSFDAEGLIRTTAEKNVVLEQLKRTKEPLLEQKEALAKLWNLAEGEIGLEEFVNKAPAESAGLLKQLGGDLIRLAQKVSAQLQRNRAMFEEGLAFVNDTLSSFQSAITGENMAYSPLPDRRQRKPGAVRLRREV